MADPIRNLRPIVAARDQWQPTAATFTCDRCGGHACTLTLVPPHARDPQAPLPGEPGWLPGEGTVMPDTFRLSIDGPVKITHHFGAAAEGTVAAVTSRLLETDAPGLFAINPEYVPSWCGPCAKNYCRTCWVVWVDSDEGFYDCTRGRCPEDHYRVMDD